MIYALTPTGNRPEAISLLSEYIGAQTYKDPLTWIVVDDCEPETYIPKMRDNIIVERVRPPWRWESGMNTQAKCMTAGLERVPDDATLFILEDDDVYLSKWIEFALNEMAHFDLIGEIDARYYNVATHRWRSIRGKVHASLSSTVCKGDALKYLRHVCNTQIKMLDFHLWKGFKGAKQLMHTHLTIGIKGLPGRPGVGIGHRRNFGKPDNFNVIGQWLGHYSRNYEIFAS